MSAHSTPPVHGRAKAARAEARAGLVALLLLVLGASLASAAQAVQAVQTAQATPTAMAQPVAASAPGAPTLASGPAAPASGPTARQLAALCANCAIVTDVAIDRRKGKASGAGAVGGAVVGGVVGSHVGNGGLIAKGTGAVAGGLLGNEIEKRIKRQKVWVTSVMGRDGKVQKFESTSDSKFRPGDTVRIDQGALVAASAAAR